MIQENDIDEKIKSQCADTLADQESQKILAMQQQQQESKVVSKTMNAKQCQQARDVVEQERLLRWKERRAKETSRFVIKKEENGDLHWEDEKNFGLEKEDDLFLATRSAATGAASPEFARLLITQAHNSFHKNRVYDKAFYAKATEDALLALNPKDEIEGMLCVRLIALHNESMRHMSGMANDFESTHWSIDQGINWAGKLFRLYNETLDTLNRYRRKGEQKVIVQHVNVKDGGQAIVNGQLNQEGGGHDKK